MEKMLNLKKEEIERLEERARRYMLDIQNLDTPYELALFGKGIMDKLVEVQTLLDQLYADVRMIEYFIKEGK
jgi:uncharacterized protein YecA (UPF0149 family)